MNSDLIGIVDGVPLKALVSHSYTYLTPDTNQEALFLVVVSGGDGGAALMLVFQRQGSVVLAQLNATQVNIEHAMPGWVHVGECVFSVSVFSSEIYNYKNEIGRMETRRK